MALPTLRIIGFIIGIFLITLAISMVVPMATLVIFDRTSDLPSFLWASMITFVDGTRQLAVARVSGANQHRLIEKLWDAGHSVLNVT
jgi:trk system potassium uptake protein TrkH